MAEDFVYLASGSPRRRELLRQIGVPFQLLGVEVDESIKPGEPALAYVTRLARAKAAAGCEKISAGTAGVAERGTVAGIAAAAKIGAVRNAPVLAADTAVVFEGKILGKPAHRQDGLDMLRQLSGRTHEVLTAIAVMNARGVESRVSRSEVTFRAISVVEAQAYWDTAEPCDKAGGYAIQGLAAVFVADLRGSYSGVMGLPLYETAELLAAAAVPRWL
jgi:septum formation protein